MIIKFLYYIPTIIILISFVSAVQIGISPPQIEFEGNVGEKICKTIKLFSEQEERFIGTDRWSNEKYFVKDINKYNINSSTIGIEFDYPRELISKEKSEIEICVKGDNPGEYYGAIIYSTNKSAAVGSWIILKVHGDKDGIKNNTKETVFITGRIVGGTNGNQSSFFFITLNLMSTVILSFILIVLLKAKKN